MLSEDFKAVFPQLGDRLVAVGSERDARISMMRHSDDADPMSLTLDFDAKLGIAGGAVPLEQVGEEPEPEPEVVRDTA